MADPTLIPDGTLNFAGGQNAALDPDQIAANQYYIGVNVKAETGSLQPRWGIAEIPLDWSLTGTYKRFSGEFVTFEEVFLDGKFQSFIPYSIGPDFYNIYVVSGFIFLVNLQDLSVQVLNKTDQLNVYADRINWSSAGRFLVLFDFPNAPMILDGITARRSNLAADEVPVSVLGTHNQNRLAIANAGIDWTAGDPAGNPLTPNAPITFTEIIQASSDFVGDVYQIPTANKNNDTITAMGYLQVLDKSTEIGSLLVATQSALYSYPTFLPRNQWQGGAGATNPTNVFGSLLLATGIVGQRAQVNINSDFIFLSPEGLIYCLTMSRNDQYKWSNSAISREVKNFLKYIDPTLGYVAFAQKYKNKIFISCNPHRVSVASSEGIPQFDYVSSGVVVIETNNMASLSNQTPPAWAGAWTGIGFLDMVENQQKFYVAGKHNGRNGMFIMDPEKTYDELDGKVRYVRSVVFTKEYTNTDTTINKEIHSLEVGVRDIKEKVTIQAAYKPDTVTNYTPWKNEVVYNSPYEQCEAYPCFANGLAPQGIRDLTFGGVSDKDCDPASKQMMRWYKGVQLRLVISGRDWTVKYIKLKSKILSQTEPSPYCTEKEGVPVEQECFDIWAIPKEEC